MTDTNDQSFKNQDQESDSKRKLILHFDQHNTIQVACTLPGCSVTVEQGLNNFLTSAVWGKEIDNEWVWTTNGQPQLHKPKNDINAITYFKFLEKKIVNKPEDRVEFKKKTSNFVYEEPGIKFREYFDWYLQSLTYNDTHCVTNEYNNYETNNLPCNTIPSGDPENKSLYNLIFPEFFDMIRRLQQQNRKFTIILRTMGIDSQQFLNTIKLIFDGKHKHFKDIKPMKVNTNIGQIKRFDNDRIQLEMDGQIYDGDEAIYNKLNSLDGVNAIRDDFHYWQENEYDCYSAKPLWIDLTDPFHQHILFDDNIRLDDEHDCIVNVRLKNANKNIFENIDFSCYNIFEKCVILQPNLIELLNPHLKLDSNKNPYCEKLKRSEKIYSKLFNKKESYNIRIKYVELENNNYNNDHNNNKIILDSERSHINNDQENLSHENHSKKRIIKEEEQEQSIDVQKELPSFANTSLSRKKNKSFFLINQSLSFEIQEEEKKIDKENKNISKICTLQ
jgi:hypothetical protein